MTRTSPSQLQTRRTERLFAEWIRPRELRATNSAGIRFLTAMEGWGYELADVEREMLHPAKTKPTPEQ